MSRIEFLITGGNGQLGRSLLAAAAARGLAAVGCSHAELPVEAAERVRQLLREYQPRHVLHCGAWTDVDGCEADPAAADRQNGQGTANLVAACAELDCGLVYTSTDFVFDGKQTQPYDETAAAAPLSAYGRSKWLGEQAVLAQLRPSCYVLRTSWVFGPGGRNFPRAILQRARSGQELRVVSDQIGRPSYTEDLAAAMLDLASSGAEPGIYHAANTGSCSWHQFAVELLAAAGLGHLSVTPITAAELARKAPRPAYSVLGTRKLDALRGPLPHYRDALQRYLMAEHS